MRSFLYVPGNRPSMLASALGRGADALIVDLEDAVPPTEKAAARAAVAEWLRTLPPGAPVWVRVNAGPAGLDDTQALLAREPDGAGSGRLPAGAVVRGLVVAKASLEQVTALGRLLDELDPAGGVGVVPLLETPQAILAAAGIAAAPRVNRMQIGEADLAAELGVSPGEDERELLFARSAVVLASAAAGIEPPAAAVTTDFRDLDALRRSTEALKRLGFRGRACIHPAQIPIVHEVFTPADSEIAAARDLIARFEAAGGGVCLDARGRMVDLAVIRNARRTAAYADSAWTWR
ncbi:CoA ester lyase [Actinoplanes sp. L3-i22]|uniref:HpcH/HpaI aldolase/citrate lyase family protein n=1 Tax=Actinoplanes sp. L3-i22 TaxID=2836373 RepID=UPI001C748F8D|nr:CoA ester lyase [Actinoplanes sp. L3-i22]BCY12843.1 CoA ester lyase [Actinoplanes sp. L3-i22]